MNFTIKTKDFLKLLNITSPALAAKSPLAALTYFKLRVLEGAVSVEANDMVTSIRAFAAVAYTSPGEVGVHGKSLVDVVSTIPAEEIAVSVVDNRLSIATKKSVVHLNVLGGEMFPATTLDEQKSWQPADGFFTVLDRVSFACSKDDNRPVLQGIYMKSGEVVAVDGHRLAIVYNNFTLPRPVIIPSSAVNQLRKVFADKLEISFGTSEIYFRQPGFIASVRLMDGDFPNYAAVIPSGDFESASAKKADLLTAIAVVSSLGDTQKYTEFLFTPNKLLVSAKADLGEACYDVDVNYGGEFKTAFNAQYIKESLSRCQDDVTLELRGKNAPIVIKGGDYLHVIMPKRS